MTLVAVVALAVAGTLLAWRGIAGPPEWTWFTMKSPLNAQCIVGLTFTAILLLHVIDAAPVMTRTKYPLFWLLAILTLTIASLWRAIQFPLVFDDYTLVRYGQGMTPAMMKYYFTQAGGDGFFRPVGYLSFGFDALWAARDPLRWHLTGLILHLANTALVWRLGNRIAADSAAGLWAAAVFALHGSIPFTPTYLAARFDVLSVFFVFSGLLLFLIYLDTDRRVTLAASLVCMVLAFLTKETAYVFPLLILVVAGSKAKANWRAFAAFFTVAATGFACRYKLLGGLGGYRNPVTGMLDVSNTSYINYFKGFGLRIWSAFYFPVNWSHRLEPWLSITLLVCLVALFWLGLNARAPRSQVLRALAFIGVALLPLAHLLLVDARLLGAGRFYLALAGFSVLMGIAIRATPMPMQAVVGTVLVIFQLAALSHNVTIWGETSTLASQTCMQAAKFAGPSTTKPAATGLPRDIDGIPFLANGFESCVDFYRPFDDQSVRPAAEFVWDEKSRRLVSK